MKADYAKHYEVLMAVVTHLAVNKWAIRQPRGLAKDLSIEVEEIKVVLKTFKGLFRESPGTSRDHGDHFYALHIRHSRQAGGENPDQERPPLEPEYLYPLLKFVADKAAQQSQHTASFKIAGITSVISLLVAGASLFVAFNK